MKNHNLLLRHHLIKLKPIIAALFCCCFVAGIKAQCPGSNTGYVNGSYALNNTSGGTVAWSNPSNALTDNNQYATMSNAALVIGGTVRSSNFLVLQNLNLNIPVNAQVCGIEVEIRKYSSDSTSSNYTKDIDVRLLKSNQIAGTNHANVGVNWSTSETASVYGSSSDLWGTSLTGFDVSNSGFGVVIEVESKASGLLLPTVTSYIDGIRMRVYYTVPATDADGDGVVNTADSDLDGDGKINSSELMICSSPSILSLLANTDAALCFPTAGGIAASIHGRSTTGAGVSAFNISENYTAVIGPEIYVSQDVSAASDHSVQVLRFNSPVHNLSFKIQDIDMSAGQMQDKIMVEAYSAGQVYLLTASNYTIGTGNFNQYDGNNTFKGLLNMADSELNGSISINIPGMVDSVRFTYSNADVVNLGSQIYGIGEISYCNPYSPSQDFDSDGAPDFADRDSDNDGILDLTEYQPSVGFVPPAGADSDGDGIDNAYDSSTGGITVTQVDTDGDNTFDFHDADSDDDGFSDQQEGNDANFNCAADFNLVGIDTDADGLDNSYDPDNGGTSAPVQDRDGNGSPDFRQNTVPTASDAGADQTGCGPFTMAANNPVSGTGIWTVVSGAATFSSNTSYNTSLSGLNTGTNTYAWTVATDGCHSSADTVAIVVNTPPVVTLNPLNAVCITSGPVTLSGGLPAGGTYSGTGVSSGSFIPAVAGTGSHAITYTFTSSNGCSSSASQNITVNECLSLEDHDDEIQISVYPNPTDEVLNIQASIDLSYSMVSSDGKVIFLQKTIEKDHAQALDVTKLPAGIYYMIFRDNDHSVSKKVVIK